MFMRTKMLSCQARKIIKVMATKSDIHMFYFNIYVVGVLFYYVFTLLLLVLLLLIQLPYFLCGLYSTILFLLLKNQI
jgi:hypothetical protein